MAVCQLRHGLRIDIIMASDLDYYRILRLHGFVHRTLPSAVDILKFQCQELEKKGCLCQSKSTWSFLVVIQGFTASGGTAFSTQKAQKNGSHTSVVHLLTEACLLKQESQDIQARFIVKPKHSARIQARNQWGKISFVQFLTENCLKIFGEDITSLFEESSVSCDTSDITDNSEKAAVTTKQPLESKPVRVIVIYKKAQLQDDAKAPSSMGPPSYLSTIFSVPEDDNLHDHT
ncbi:hypothetical protein J1605_011694 [Eschrichtius robustus]|uniref:Uncharacterized protein n=1 Tax=Eschrichtius robustus TaxID=9764 RepID=A0AB34GP46_ESCRO|nr:hypothetical protein J1605_011694 [Eschrichtius robustus]